MKARLFLPPITIENDDARFIKKLEFKENYHDMPVGNFIDYDIEYVQSKGKDATSIKYPLNPVNIGPFLHIGLYHMTKHTIQKFSRNYKGTNQYR